MFPYSNPTTRERTRAHRHWLAASGVVSTLAVVTLSAGAARPDRDAAPATLLGAPVSFGHGTARVYVTMEGGKPFELGVALSDAALHGLPHPAPGAPPDEMHFVYSLPLPEGNPTPFRAVELGWNPHGHEPTGVYTLPHFDFHFYTIETDAIDAIDPANPEYETLGARLPDPDYIPTRYVVPEFHLIPRMGLHWIDREAPEMNGRPFTTTFIYGSWDGRLIFAEPMITKAVIESKQTFEAEVPVAERYQTPGYHPSSYRIYWDQGSREHRIALTGLTFMN